jgi:hypothetical protein
MDSIDIIRQSKVIIMTYVYAFKNVQEMEYSLKNIGHQT